MSPAYRILRLPQKGTAVTVAENSFQVSVPRRYAETVYTAVQYTKRTSC
jgi:hypothetical protein